EAARERVQEVNPRLLEEIQELGRRLLYISAAEEVKFPRQPPWSDDPRLLVAKLEASAEGCRWLLARWAEFRILLDRGARWDTPALLRFIRLQGKQVAESVYDPVLNVIFVAWDVLVPKFAAEEWENFREERFRTDPSFNHRQCWREIVARPSNAAEAREVLDTIIADHVENLKELLARNEAIEAVADPDWADRAALDLSPGFERLRRYQSARHRELLRTLETLRKMRKEEFGTGNGEAEKADGKCQVAEDRGQMADDGCQVAEGRGRMANDECQVAEGEVQVAGGELKMGDEQCEVEAGGCDERHSSEPMTEASSGPIVGHDSQRNNEDATDDGAHAAGQPGQGDGVGQFLPDDVTTPQKAPNKANLESKQSLGSQELKSETAGAEGRKQSQSSKGETRRKPSSRDGRPARQSGPWPVGREAQGSALLRAAGVPPLRRSDDLDSPGDGQL